MAIFIINKKTLVSKFKQIRDFIKIINLKKNLQNIIKNVTIMA